MNKTEVEFKAECFKVLDLHKSRGHGKNFEDNPSRHLNILRSYWRGEIGDEAETEEELVEILWLEYTDMMSRFKDGFPARSDCGPGWYRLICDINKRLRTIKPDYGINQIKEKFGSLRYYHNIGRGGDGDPLIALAWPLTSYGELLSGITCEHCGDRGDNQNSHGYIITLCEACYEPFNAEREKRFTPKTEDEKLADIVARQKDATPRDCC